jgi:hypothetical protein
MDRRDLSDAMDNTAHTTTSSTREKLIEHLFIGELLRHLWLQGIRDMEVLRAEVDCGGFDLVVECGGILRHIQLKASHKKAKTDSVGINTALSKKPSGCVIWLFFDEATLEFSGFRWFGAGPGRQLPALGDKVARHSKPNSKGVKTARPRIREIKKSAFQSLVSIEEVAGVLFGSLCAI